MKGQVRACIGYENWGMKECQLNKGTTIGGALVGT